MIILSDHGGGFCRHQIYRHVFRARTMNALFDIVIPVGPNDREVIEKQIIYTKKNILDSRHIYLIYRDLSLQIEGCTTITESIFPFSLETIAKHHGKSDRNGWYFQQLLKLYAGFVIPGILERYLVIDSDTFFLKPMSFIKDNKCMYTIGNQYHRPYFLHMYELHETFKRQFPNISGIAHHMMFEIKFVKQIMELVEAKHGGLFYDIFLKNVTNAAAGASEYEIYFNYIASRHLDKIIIRNLKWINTGTLDVESDNDYISYHHWMR
jgi:hypothetical protein